MSSCVEFLQLHQQIKNMFVIYETMQQHELQLETSQSQNIYTTEYF